MHERGFIIDRRVPVALLLTLALQAATAVWWASSQEAQDRFRDQRLSLVEQKSSSASERQIEMLQRLSRLEALAEANGDILRKIEARLRKAP